MKRLLLLFIAIGLNGYSQVKNPFDIRYQSIVRGDLAMISNNIVSQHVTNAYNSLTVPNDQINMQYVDVDADATTYNSSSATLNIANSVCSRVVYAGLYWSATYRFEIGNNPTSGRFSDWNTVKFKVPGGNYQTITANEVLYNGFSDVNQTNVEHGPYSCYANVTQYVSMLTNPNGEYFVGNIRVSRNGMSSSAYPIAGGVSGGWSLVVVYEDPNLPGKFITTFDGHAVISSSMTTPLDIPVNGFHTVPTGVVKARMGLLALEGDYNLTGDKLSIKSNMISTFTNLSNSGSSASVNNFFNSSITSNSSAMNSISDRNPNSTNTLGWDSHLNLVTNPINSILPNNETGAILRATSTADKYDILFASFDVEIIEPNVIVVNTAENFAGNNINGQNLNMGDEYYYKISFNNSGNDNAVNFTITDSLPKNVIFPASGGAIQQGDIVLPAGVTYVYNPVLKKFDFTIPNSLVQTNFPTYNIKIKVKVEDNCANLEESCSNLISNQVYSSYHGEINPQIITNNPSTNGYYYNCFPIIQSVTNIIVNSNQCNFSESQSLCAGNSAQLSAPSGYQDYSWTFNGNNIGNTQEITVNELGSYAVSMSALSPCNSITKVFNVIDCTLGNQDFAFSDFQYYPNPVKDSFIISNASTLDEVEIISILGQKIISKKVNDIQTEIDLSQLSNGIYFVKVTCQGNEKTVKIIKQ